MKPAGALQPTFPRLRWRGLRWRGLRVCVLATLVAALLLWLLVSYHRHTAVWTQEVGPTTLTYSTRGCMDGVVTVQPGGRLGNLLMEYSCAAILAERHRLRLAMPAAILEPLSAIFQNLSAEPLAALLRQPPCAGLGLSEEQFLDDPRHRLLTWGDVEGQLQRLRRDHLPLVFMCARWGCTCAGRTTCSGWRATSACARRWASPTTRPPRPPCWQTCAAVAFAVTSDDSQWCQQTLLPAVSRPASELSRWFLLTSASAGQDLCLLSSCQHLIMTYGTFGLSAAILSRGRTIMFDSVRHGARKPSYPEEMVAMVPGWRLVA